MSNKKALIQRNDRIVEMSSYKGIIPSAIELALILLKPDILQQGEVVKEIFKTAGENNARKASVETIRETENITAVETMGVKITNIKRSRTSTKGTVYFS